MDNNPYILDPEGDVILLFPNVNRASPLSQSFETSRQTVPSASPTTSLTIDASAVGPNAGAVHTLSVLETHPNQQSNSTLTDESEGSVRMCVSSKHLALASPVFKRMFSGNWNEAHEIRSEGATVIVMDIWDVDAMLIVMNIIHCYAPKVPRKVDLDTLAKVAVIVDYYQCPGVAEAFADMWVDHLKSDMPKSFAKPVLQWICIAWVFRKPTEFFAATLVALYLSPAVVQTYGLPIPNRVIEKINGCRQQAIQEAMAAIDLVIDALSSPHQTCSYECSSIRLGALIKSLRLYNLVFPDPRPPFDNMSIASLVKSLTLVQSPVWETRWQSSMGPQYERHRCTLEPLVDPIHKDLKSKMNGLKLEDYA